MENSDMACSKWHRELEVFSQIKSAIILEGNIYDSYPYPSGDMAGAWLTLDQYLQAFFEQRGYANIIRYNHIDGFSADTPDALSRFAEATNSDVKDGKIAAKFAADSKGAPMLIREAMRQIKEPFVIVMELASRYIVAPDRLVPADQNSYTILLQGILSAAEVGRADARRQNMLVFITSKRNDMPPWMYLGVNQVQGINIDFPTAEQRRAFLGGNDLSAFFDRQVYAEDAPSYQGRAKDWEHLIDRFVARTEGFTFFELEQLRALCKSQKIRVPKLCSVIDLYTYGIQDNPWEGEALNHRLADGENFIKRRVKGQDDAVRQSLDIVKRAVSGLSKVRSSASPKGVLFFAGPTGTGKTETAKTLAELVFGDESACIRFDMSEYMHSNSDQRLLGAPPGYVGYEAGGQLTNAVRKNPFSILLFDEIEKASPTIMDKFLQILEDGRMTDGQGNTAYFSDCLIIFTSNLGIYTTDRYGNRQANVTPEMASSEVREHIISAIQDHFKLELGRPEILNRIGENIVVFDYIGKDAARSILKSRLDSIRQTMQDENGIDVDFSRVEEPLYQLILKNLENGGRGINNVVEKALINPLARHIFDEHVQRGERRIITQVDAGRSPADIEWRQA